METVEQRRRPADPDPHAPRPVVRSVGEREVLRPREARFRQLQRSEAVALVRVHHELHAHGDADRAPSESHRPRHHGLDAGDVSVFLGHPGRELEVTPRVVEEHLPEVGLARGL